MKTDVYILATVEGGITSLILATTDEDEANEAFDECLLEPPAGYTNRADGVKEEGSPTCHRFAWNEGEYEIRMWKEAVHIDARSIAHDAFMEYDPDEHDYVCPNGIAACPCGAVDRTESENDTDVPA